MAAIWHLTPAAATSYKVYKGCTHKRMKTISLSFKVLEFIMNLNCPGLNFIYVHVYEFERQYDLFTWVSDIVYFHIMSSSLDISQEL